MFTLLAAMFGGSSNAHGCQRLARAQQKRIKCGEEPRLGIEGQMKLAEKTIRHAH